MATASELLGDVSVVDKTLVISNDFRTINIPSSVPNLGVEYDDDVLRLDFKMPRYVSDTDLSKFAIRINYINSKGESDAYTVSDAKVYSEYITFSWLVGPTATRYKGTAKFIVCLKTVKTDGTVDREFNTTIATLPVLEGLEVDESIVTEYSDIIEQWRKELFGIGDTEEASIKAVSEAEQAAIENKGAEVLATIPADYQTAVSMTDNAERSKADAITCSVQGDLVQVKDSSDDYLRGLNIYGKTTQVTTTGKNLLNVPDTISTTKGVTFRVNSDGSIAATGTPTEVFAVSLYGTYGEPIAFPAGTYIISGGVDENHYLRVRIHSSDGTLKTMRYSNGVDKDFTVEDGELISISIYFATLTGVNNMMFYPMVRDAVITDNTYEPYSGGITSPHPDWPQELISVDNPTIDIYGKNLAVQKYAIDSTVNGIRIATSNEASEALLNGTAEKLFSHTVLRTGLLSPGTYTVSISGVNIHDDGHDRLYVADYLTGKIYANYIRDGSPKTIVLPEAARLRIDMVFKAGTTYENQTLKVQIEAGSVATVYEPCKTIQSFTLNHTFPGVPVDESGNYTDINGQQWICDEIDLERGVYIQRTKTLLFNGTENWYISAAQYSEGTRFDVNIPNVPPALVQNVVCDRFVFKGPNAGVETAWVLQGTAGFRVITTKASAVEDFITFLTENPTTIIYAINTPIETPLTAEEIEWFRFAHTNYPNTTILNDAGATMKLKYNADTKIWLDNVPKVTDEQAGPLVEAWMDEHFTDAEGVIYGKSAYEIALERGFVGSEAHWLASLKGEKGDVGATGATGATGEKGDKGDTGATGDDGYTPVKGTDYYTDADKEEMVADVIAAMPEDVDYIVAEGTSGVWTYRKWNSGIAECWACVKPTKDEMVGGAVSEYDNKYYASYKIQPPFQFAREPYCGVIQPIVCNASMVSYYETATIANSVMVCGWSENEAGEPVCEQDIEIYFYLPASDTDGDGYIEWDELVVGDAWVAIHIIDRWK